MGNMDGYYNQQQVVNYSANGSTGHEVSQSSSYRASSQIWYQLDVRDSSASEWYYSPTDYSSAIASVNTALKIFEGVSSRANSYKVELQSPEGKTLQGSVNSCFTSLGTGVGDIGLSVYYCGAWANKRLEAGIKAEKLTQEDAKALAIYKYWRT